MYDGDDTFWCSRSLLIDYLFTDSLSEWEREAYDTDFLTLTSDSTYIKHTYIWLHNKIALQMNTIKIMN